MKIAIFSNIKNLVRRGTLFYIFQILLMPTLIENSWILISFCIHSVVMSLI